MTRPVPSPLARSGRYLLFRVDDRLLHGQVSIGWGQRFGPTRYLIVDDAAAADPIARRLYGAARPAGAEVEVLSEEQFLAAPRPEEITASAFLLVRSVAGAARLLRGGVPGPANLGGVHDHPEATEVLAYLHLTPSERKTLLALLAEGFDLYAQDLPEAPALSGESLRSRLEAGS